MGCAELLTQIEGTEPSPGGSFHSRIRPSVTVDTRTQKGATRGFAAACFEVFVSPDRKAFIFSDICFCGQVVATVWWVIRRGNQ
jgi:hypothetical protein